MKALYPETSFFSVVIPIAAKEWEKDDDAGKKDSTFFCGRQQRKLSEHIKPYQCHTK